MSMWKNAPVGVEPPPYHLKDLDEAREYMKTLADMVAIIAKELNFIINGNVDGKNIRPESVETRNLKAGSVIAEKIDVDELSAISANLGHITAGLIEAIQIFGSYIATANGTFPRAEMSILEHLFAVYLTPDNWIKFTNEAVSGNPGFMFSREGVIALFYQLVGNMLWSTAASQTGIIINAGKDLQLLAYATGGYKVKVADWSEFVNAFNGRSLQTDLNSKANTFIGATDSITVVTDVDFALQTKTTKTVNYVNGIAVSIS